MWRNIMREGGKRLNWDLFTSKLYPKAENGISDWNDLRKLDTSM